MAHPCNMNRGPFMRMLIRFVLFVLAFEMQALVQVAQRTGSVDLVATGERGHDF